MKISVLLLTLVIVLVSCQKDPVSSSGGEAKITLSARYVTSGLVKSFVGNGDNLTLISAISVTRARFLVRNVTLRSIPEEDSVEFVSDPYILDLNLDGEPNIIEVNNVPADTYDRVDFKIHRLDDDDPRDLAYFQHPDFQEFVNDNRYSMIIEGTISEGTNPEEAFVFRSRNSEKQRQFFDPVLVVDQSTSQVSVVFEINGSQWFTGQDGSVLDPRDESNESEISDNLKNSIRIYENKPSDDNESDDSNYSR
jgi:hypothetical protein